MLRYFFRSDPSPLAERIDRYRQQRRFRLMCGLHVTEDFGEIHGALVRARGCGKWLQPRPLHHARLAIPDHLQMICRQCREDPDHHYAQTLPAISDLAELQAEITHRLLGAAGNRAQEVLAVCVTDPGIRMTDFDQRVSYTSLCDASRLAEHSGLSVIDALPAGDIRVEGRGQPLNPLAYWLMFADRAAQVATSSRLLVEVDRQIRMTYLPASDGLDSELPEIRQMIGPGLHVLDQMAHLQSESAAKAADWAQFAAQGRFLSELISQWQQDQRWAAAGPANSSDSFDWMAPLAHQAALAHQWSLQDTLLTASRMLVSEIVETANRCSQCEPPLDQIILAGRGAKNGLIRNELAKQLPQLTILDVEHWAIQPESLHSVATAVLGLMHVDQMPANLPDLTGAQIPRVLGRLTPGRPANWRQLLLEMADYRPPAMKLRDAV